jgi:hypothetical protein
LSFLIYQEVYKGKIPKTGRDKSSVTTKDSECLTELATWKKALGNII